MRTIKFFTVLRNTDQTEGRGSMVDVYYTENEELARKIVNHPIFYGKYGVQGSPPYENGKYDVILRHFSLLDSMEEFFKFEKNEKILKALSKLTDEEKEILGLK